MKKIITLCLSLCMTAALAAPAYALEYSIDSPDDYDFGKDTSIEVIHTADGGAMRNEDVSKNAALIPPVFGSESMNALHTGEYLTPNLAPGGIPASAFIRARTARRLPKALDILRIPPSGRGMSASPPTTAAPTATSTRSTRWTSGTELP